MTQRRSMWGLLREERDFRRVYLSELISLGGDWFAIIPLLTLLPRLTGSNFWGALVLAADTLILAALSPYAGVVADRVNRKHLMVACELASAALIALLLLVRSGGTAWIALVAVGGVAAAKAFYAPAVTAAVPNLVPRDDLVTANAMSGAVWGVMLAVGAALGGLVAHAFGTDICFAIDAASFLLSALLTAFARKPFGEPRETRHTTTREDMRETFTYARADGRVIALLTSKPGTAMGNGVLALFPAYGITVFRRGEIGVGLLFAARGMGAVVGPFVMKRFVTRSGTQIWRLVAAAISTYGAAYMFFSFNPWFPAALVLVAIAHVGASTNWNVSTYALQSTVPDRIRGRVFSADFMIATLMLGLSQLLVGALGEVLPVRWVALVLAAAVFVYGGVWYAATASLRPPMHPDADGRRPSALPEGAS